jgi:hypothetical protein
VRPNKRSLLFRKLNCRTGRARKATKTTWRLNVPVFKTAGVPPTCILRYCGFYRIVGEPSNLNYRDCASRGGRSQEVLAPSFHGGWCKSWPATVCCLRKADEGSGLRDWAGHIKPQSLVKIVLPRSAATGRVLRILDARAAPDQLGYIAPLRTNVLRPCEGSRRRALGRMGDEATHRRQRPKWPRAAILHAESPQDPRREVFFLQFERWRWGQS